MVVSDGGVKDGMGYFGLAMSPFQAKAYESLAGVYLLMLLTKAATVNAKNEIRTDSMSLLSRLTRASRPYVPLGFWTKPDSDIVRQITDEVRNIHELKRTYVKGHQDLTKDKTKYTLLETYNIQADHLATAMRHTMSGPVHQVIVFPPSCINLYLLSQHISSSLDRFLYASYT